MTARLPSLRVFAFTLLLAGIVSILAACTEETTSDSVPSRSPAAAVTATQATSPTPALSFPAGATPATVVHVVDGDTIDVEIDGVEYRVRYIGVDTPETVDPRRPVGCFGAEASAANKDLVDGKLVGLEKDVRETDDFGRLLRYVWLNGSDMVNAILVGKGYAQSSAYPPDVRHQELFDQLESEARNAGRGLWGPVCAETVTPPAGTPVPGACEYSTTSDPVIKGNINADDEKIYHVPGGGFYSQTVVNEAAGEQWFCTEAEAMAAGWRKSLR